MAWGKGRRSGNKYGAKGCYVVDGQIIEIPSGLSKQDRALFKEALGDNCDFFHSKAEAGRWLELQFLEKNGEISKLKRQVRFPFHLGGETHHYVMDFTYKNPLGEHIAEDKKGFATETYKLKRALFKEYFGGEYKFKES